MSDPLVRFCDQLDDGHDRDREEAERDLPNFEPPVVRKGVRQLVETSLSDDTDIDERREAIESVYTVAAVIDLDVADVPLALFDADAFDDRRTRMLVGTVANALEINYGRLAVALRNGTTAEQRGAAGYYAFCSQTGGSPSFVKAQAAGDERVCEPLLALVNAEDETVQRAASRTIRIRFQEGFPTEGGTAHVPHTLVDDVDPVLAAMDHDDPLVRHEATVAVLFLTLVIENDDYDDVAGAALASFEALDSDPTLDAQAAVALWHARQDLLKYVPDGDERTVLDGIVARSDEVRHIDETLHELVVQYPERMGSYVDALVADFRSNDGAAARVALDSLYGLVTAVRDTNVWSFEDNYGTVFGAVSDTLAAQVDRFDGDHREAAETTRSVVDDITSDS